MLYTVILNDRSYDLPKKTIAVTELLDKTGAVDTLKISTREKYRKVLDCIKQLIGKEATAEALGSDDLDEVDLSEVAITFQKIVDAYNRPVQDFVNASGMEALSRVPLSEIAELANSATQIINAADAVKK